MQNITQQPCYHRIKRILHSYHQSADRSLKGPDADGDDRVTVGATAPNLSKSLHPDAARPGCYIVTPPEKNVEIVRNVSAPVKTEICSVRTDSMLPTERWSGETFRGETTSRKTTAHEVMAISKRSNTSVASCPLLIAAEGSTSYELTETILKDKSISCFKIGGERRLCMPQVLKEVLYIFTRVQIQSISDSLHINFAECNAAQLEALKKRGVLPPGVPRCGLITQTDAERLCAALLESPPATCLSRLDSTAIPVTHECFGGCKGVFLPREYISPSSLCIECLQCNGRLNPLEFVTHTHSRQEDRICHWGFDMSNWRFYMMLSPNSDDTSVMQRQQKVLDDLKSRFLDKETSSVATEDLVSSTSHGSKKVKLDISHKVAIKSPCSSDDVSDKWKPVNPYTTWAACLNMVQRLKHVQHSLSDNALPSYLCTGAPVLENPHRVVPFDDAERYDRNFAPNVSLSVEPFDELRKLRQEAHFDEEISAIDTAPSAVTDCGSTSVQLALVQRRWTQSSADDAHDDDDDDDEDDSEEYDTESVSSDKLEAEQEAVADEELVRNKMLMVDVDSQLAFVRAAVCDNEDMDQSVKQSMINHLRLFQGRQVQMIKALDEEQCSVQQAVREVWSSIEAQRLTEKQRYEDELLRQRQEGAAKMREAVLERHRLLQQIETFSGPNTSSDQAVMAARYKDEAEYWKSRLEEAEAMNSRLQQELTELRKALVSQQLQQTIWMSSKSPAAVDEGPSVVALLVADREKCRRDVAVSPLQSS